MRALGLVLLALAACGGSVDLATDGRPAGGAAHCRRLLCACTVYDARTLKAIAELPRFAVVACTSEPVLEASDECGGAATMPCACASCDAAPE
jgi:hypothetical protein